MKTKAPKANLKRAGGGLPRLAYNPRETAKILGVSQTSVYRLIERELLDCSPHLRHKIIPLTAIEAFLQSGQRKSAA